MRLSHFTGVGFEYEAGRRYEQKQDMKPNGLWVSADGSDDWLSWCLDEGFAPDRRHRHRVVADLDRVLVLSTVEQLVKFSEEFVVEDPQFPEGMIVDWPAVSQRWAGVIIAPYQWECRFGLLWYYGWDCASGCIWDLSVIRSVEPCG